MKNQSKYERKFIRRKRAGMIHYQLTADKDGHETLNPRDFRSPFNASGSMRSFSRMPRADEV